MATDERAKPSIGDRLRDFWLNTKRIIRVARRPTAQEVRLIARVSGIGILIVGAVAFLIQILGNLVNEFFKPPTSSSTTTSLVIMLINLLVQFNISSKVLTMLSNPAIWLMASGLILLAKSKFAKV